MNKEIKYRCFYRGQMLQIEEMQLFSDGSISVTKAVHPEDDHIGIYIDSEHVKAIVQYIGKLDKNGKEIYEGDIVKYSDKWVKDKIHEVPLLRDCFITNQIGYELENRTDAECEVIGNIHFQNIVSKK